MKAQEPRLIDPNPHARPAAPADVWDFHRYASWKDEVWALVETFADQAVQASFKADPPEYVVSDDLTWLEDRVRDVHSVSIDAMELMVEALQRRYRNLRAAHGSRPTDVAVLYREGLVPLDPARIHARAREIFLSVDYPEVTEVLLEQAIEGVGHVGRADRVWFECNETELVRRNGHYMLYGSEYLLAIAAHMDGRDYRPELKRFGEPVVFICDVPLSWLHPGALRAFAGTAVEVLFEELMGETDGPSPTRGAGFSIRQTLPPDHIVGHYVPLVGRDPIAMVRRR